MNQKLKTSTIKGVLVILVASLCWGIGNAITGLTAHEYLSSGLLFPAIDIALCNTLGGLFFVIVVLLVRITTTKHSLINDEKKKSQMSLSYFKNRFSIPGGALKGANTCLFVFSTTYIVATQSLIWESTYVIWSLILGLVFLGRRTSFWSSFLKVLLLVAGIALVAGQTNFQLGSGLITPGAVFGILAGFSYAFYLFFWSFVTKDLEGLRSQLVATIVLLTISLFTILIFSESVSFVLLHHWWMPLTNLKSSDVILQFLNGILVIGVVYLLITIGMSILKNIRQGSNFIAAVCLSFSIPFTLLTEFVIGKFTPTSLQLIGTSLFMVGFILISTSISINKQKE